jgi:hypothetical protein
MAEPLDRSVQTGLLADHRTQVALDIRLDRVRVECILHGRIVELAQQHRDPLRARDGDAEQRPGGLQQVIGDVLLGGAAAIQRQVGDVGGIGRGEHLRDGNTLAFGQAEALGDRHHDLHARYLEARGPRLLGGGRHRRGKDKRARSQNRPDHLSPSCGTVPAGHA